MSAPATPAKRRLLLSAATNWLAFAATLLTAFFLAPYLIGKLGDARYGVWVFVESILAYFTLFDLGIAACLVRFVARFHAERDETELNRMASACLALFLAAGAVVMLCGLVLGPVLGPALSERVPEATGLAGFVLLMMFNLAATLPLSVFPSILDGLERYAIKSAVRVVFLALRVGGMVWVCETAPGLFPLAVVYTLTNLAEHAVMAVLCFRFLPGLRFSRRLIDRATLRRVRGYSVDAFLAMVAGRVSFQSASLVIGFFLAVPKVTHFALAFRLVEMAKSLLRAATTTLTPAISSLEATGDHAAIRRILLHATRWVLYLILPIQLGMVVFGGPFFATWLGSPEYAGWCYPSLVILSSALAVAIAQSVCARILYGTGRLRLFARLALLEAGVNLALSLLLVRRFGIEGVAVAVAVPNLVGCLVVIAYTCRVVGVPVGEYVRRAWLMPLALLAVPAAVWLLATDAGSLRGWGELIPAGAAGLVPYALAVLAAEGKVAAVVGRLVRRRVSVSRAEA